MANTSKGTPPAPEGSQPPPPPPAVGRGRGRARGRARGRGRNNPNRPQFALDPIMQSDQTVSQPQRHGTATLHASKRAPAAPAAALAATSTTASTSTSTATSAMQQAGPSTTASRAAARALASLTAQQSHDRTTAPLLGPGAVPEFMPELPPPVLPRLPLPAQRSAMYRVSATHSSRHGTTAPSLNAPPLPSAYHPNGSSASTVRAEHATTRPNVQQQQSQFSFSSSAHPVSQPSQSESTVEPVARRTVQDMGISNQAQSHQLDGASHALFGFNVEDTDTTAPFFRANDSDIEPFRAAHRRHYSPQQQQLFCAADMEISAAPASLLNGRALTASFTAINRDHHLPTATSGRARGRASQSATPISQWDSSNGAQHCCVKCGQHPNATQLRCGLGHHLCSTCLITYAAEQGGVIRSSEQCMPQALICPTCPQLHGLAAVARVNPDIVPALCDALMANSRAVGRREGRMQAAQRQRFLPPSRPHTAPPPLSPSPLKRRKVNECLGCGNHLESGTICEECMLDIPDISDTLQCDTENSLGSIRGAHSGDHGDMFSAFD
jgi:hypothetical protein